MCVGKNTSQPANVRNVRPRRTLSALQRAAAFSKKWQCHFFDTLKEAWSKSMLLFYAQIRGAGGVPHVQRRLKSPRRRSGRTPDGHFRDERGRRPLRICWNFSLVPQGRTLCPSARGKRIATPSCAMVRNHHVKKHTTINEKEVV